MVGTGWFPFLFSLRTRHSAGHDDVALASRWVVRTRSRRSDRGLISSTRDGLVVPDTKIKATRSPRGGQNAAIEPRGGLLAGPITAQEHRAGHRHAEDRHGAAEEQRHAGAVLL